jgi:nicotinamide phosphoribosyltransferase
MNPIMMIDGYKLDHRRQYPEGTEVVYSNFTPRMSRIPDQGKVTFVGLQYFLRKYLMEEFGEKFFGQDIDKICERYERRVNGYLGPNEIGTEHIRELHELGYIPLTFRAVPEGTSVDLRFPFFTVENTHPNFAWLVNYFETLLSSVLWMPCTSATTASRYRALLEDFAEKTGSAQEFVDFQGHDFSFRGLPGPEAAALSGMGHLTYFKGTDTLPAIDLIEDYYGGDFIGASVPATEHSVMCAGGADDERETYERLLALYPKGILSVVSDTWDYFSVLTDLLPSIKDKIMARDGKLVIRPDSGDPVKIICGDPNAPEGSPEYKGTVEVLWEIFGGTETATGHKLLDSHIGVIYGDSITYERCSAILAGLEAKGFASANMVFGIGSFTYQFTTRDTYGMAMKATWVQINGEGKNIFKDPVTDGGFKKSAKGRLAVVEDEFGNNVLINEATITQEDKSILRQVWADGRFFIEDDWDTITARAKAGLR